MPIDTIVTRGKKPTPHSNMRMMKNAAGEYKATPISGAGAGNNAEPTGKVIRRSRFFIPKDDKLALRQMTRYVPFAYGLLMKLYQESASDKDYILSAARRSVVISEVTLKSEYKGVRLNEELMATRYNLDADPTRVVEFPVDKWMILGFPRERDSGSDYLGWGIFGTKVEIIGLDNPDDLGKTILVSQAYMHRSDADKELEKQGDTHSFRHAGFNGIYISELDKKWLRKYAEDNKGSWFLQNRLFGVLKADWISRDRRRTVLPLVKDKPFIAARASTTKLFDKYELEPGVDLAKWNYHTTNYESVKHMGFKFYENQSLQEIALIVDHSKFIKELPEAYWGLNAAIQKGEPIYKPLCHYDPFMVKKEDSGDHGTTEAKHTDQFFKVEQGVDQDNKPVFGMYYKTSLVPAIYTLGRENCSLRFYPLPPQSAYFDLAVVNDLGETVLINAVSHASEDTLQDVMFLDDIDATNLFANG